MKCCRDITITRLKGYLFARYELYAVGVCSILLVKSGVISSSNLFLESIEKNVEYFLRIFSSAKKPSRTYLIRNGRVVKTAINKADRRK